MTEKKIKVLLDENSAEWLMALCRMKDIQMLQNGLNFGSPIGKEIIKQLEKQGVKI